MKFLTILILITTVFQTSFAQRRGAIDSTFFKNIKKDSLIKKTDNGKVIIKNDSLKSDTTKQKSIVKNFFSRENASPKKAMLMSAVFPGAGQIYNKKGWWWRLPLCYGAYGFTGYTFFQNRKNYNYYYDIVARYNNKNYKPELTEKQINPNGFTQTLANTRMLQSRKALEYSVVGILGAHIYCIADAFVTAHLNKFDMDDNITLSVSPMKIGLTYHLK